MKNTTSTSQKGKWGKVGAPPKQITFPEGRFTLKQVFAANKSVCELTVRKRVEALVDAGKVVKLASTEKQDGVGRPNFVYRVKPSSLNVVNGVKPTRKTKTKTVTTTVATVTPPVPVVTPVPATSPVVDPVVPAVVDVAEPAAV
jgi:hypothetical protein